MSMYIGSSRQCREYCKEASRAIYETEHAKQKHDILDIKSFKDDNKDYILCVQRAWQPFDKDLQTFFSKLRKEIDWIEKDAKARLLEEELKTALNSSERRLIDLSRSIFNEKFEKVTCKEVDEFLSIKNKQENSRNFLRIQKRTEEFAFDIIDDIKRAVTSIGKGITDSNNRQQERDRDREQRQKPRQRERERQRQRQRPKEDSTPMETPQPKNRETRGDNQREFRNREQRNDNKGKQQERPPRRQHRQRDQHERRGYRQERQPRRQGRRQEDQQQTRRPERQPRHQGRREEGFRDGKRPQRQVRQNNGGSNQTKTFKKVKIIDLVEGSDEFSIDIRLVSLMKNLRDRDVWKVADGSGEIKLLIPEHASFKVGSNITLNNCYIRSHGSQLQIVARLYSTITSPQIGNNVDIGSFAKKNPYKDTNNTKQRTGQTYKEFSKIGDLEPGLEGLKLIAKVLSAKAKQNTIECVLGDETGIVNARFDGGDEFLKVNNTVYLRDIETEIDGSSQGTIIVIPGKRLLMETAREQIKKVKQENNVSSRVYKVYDEE